MDAVAYIVIRSAGSLIGERQVGLGQVRVRPAEAARTGLGVAADFLSDKSSLISLRAGGGGRRKEGGGGMSIRDTEGVTLNNLRWKGLSSIFRKLTSGGGQRLLKLFVFIIDF